MNLSRSLFRTVALAASIAHLASTASAQIERVEAVGDQGAGLGGHIQVIPRASTADWVMISAVGSNGASAPADIDVFEYVPPMGMAPAEFSSVGTLASSSNSLESFGLSFDLDTSGNGVVGAPTFSLVGGMGGGSMVITRVGRAVQAPGSIQLLQGTLANERVGQSVAQGDFDGDGAVEYAVSVPGFDGAGLIGEVQFFTPSMPFIPPYDVVADPDMAVGARFGESIANLGDVDGDGADDLVIGAPGTAGMDGRVFLISGATGAILQSVTGDNSFGDVVGRAGTIDLSGTQGFFAATPTANGGSGRVGVYALPSASLLYEVDGLPQSPLLLTRFGEAVAGGRDLDGDGVDDLIVNEASPARLATVFSGATGETLRVVGRTADDTAGVTAVAFADVDDDPTSGLEILIGQLDFSASAGRVRVFDSDFFQVGCTQTLTNPALAKMTATGNNMIAANDVTLTMFEMPQNSIGYFIGSLNSGTSTTLPASRGMLCLVGTAAVAQFKRPGEIMNSGTAGSISLQVDLTDLPLPDVIGEVVPGSTWHFQGWYRGFDEDGATVNSFSDSISILFL